MNRKSFNQRFSKQVGRVFDSTDPLVPVYLDIECQIIFTRSR